MTEKQTYNSRVICDNCGHEERIDIPKGQSIVETQCPRCGCTTLRRAPWSVA